MAPLPCENPNTVSSDHRQMFVYDQKVINNVDVQRLAGLALKVLTTPSERISTRDLEALLRQILPDGKKLPFFIEHDKQPWSWFVYDDYAKQDQWQSVRVWYTLHHVDRLSNALFHSTRLQPLVSKCTESQLSADFQKIEELAALLIGMENENPQLKATNSEVLRAAIQQAVRSSVERNKKNTGIDALLSQILHTPD